MKYPLLFIFFTLLASACTPTEKSLVNHSIIPIPQIGKLYDATSNIGNIVLPISAKNDFPELAAFIDESAFMEAISFSTDEKENVKLEQNNTLNKEAYKIEITKNLVTLQYATKTGLQYGLTSLTQLLAEKQTLPTGTIEDDPRFVYRGMHLDVARHFFNVEDVKKYLDFLAIYKYNSFHWHLTEDQGWRIEIKKFPKLTEIGAYRDETIVGHNNAEDAYYNGERYGGFYTQEDIKEVVAYAANRNIEVIPEIELPGHSSAALAAYPQLGCANKNYKVATHWGVFEDIYCPYEETFNFLEDIFDEIIPLFPSKYIHIGGDEAPKTAWEESDFVQNLIKEKDLKDEHGVQSYFIQRIEKYLNSKGKQIIGWDEILEGGLAPNATVMSWRGEAGGIEAARQNHDVIMTPTTYAYLDYYQADPEGEPLAIGGKLTVADVYNWEPFPSELEPEKHKYILGAQANVWTEYIPTIEKLEYMALARLIAASEVVWSEPGLKNYDMFVNRFKYHVDYWKSKNVNIADHAIRDVPNFNH